MAYGSSAFPNKFELPPAPRNLINMLPRLTSYDELTERIRYIVLTREIRPTRTCLSLLSDLAYFLFCEFGIAVLFTCGIWMWCSPTLVPAFASLIGFVVLVCALEQVCWIDTWWVVADMTDVQCTRIIMCQHVGNSMRFQRSVVVVEAPIRFLYALESRTRPGPAGIFWQSLGYETQESFNILWRKLRKWFTLGYGHDGLPSRSLCLESC